jgi:DNA-binding CsgD family transcriptional regulator
VGVDPRDERAVAAAVRALSRLPAQGQVADLFDAIALCAPTVAGNAVILRPETPEDLVSHPVRLPQPVLRSFARMPLDDLQAALAPAVVAKAGTLQRQTEVFPREFRERVEVIRSLDENGLGEGAGYKVLDRRAPDGGPEHVILTLVAERGDRFRPRAMAALAAIAPAVRAAWLRLELPILARVPVLAQIVAEDELGYICLSTGGTLLEANRRAHDLALLYRHPAGLTGRRLLLTELATKARARARAGGRPWVIVHPALGAALEVRVHRLAKETHAIGQDVLLVKLREGPAPALPAGGNAAAVFAKLTGRQLDIARLLIRTSLSYKEIAAHVGVKIGTIRKHVEHIYRLFDVHSRAELQLLLK